MTRVDWTEVCRFVAADRPMFLGLLLELLTWRHA